MEICFSLCIHYHLLKKMAIKKKKKSKHAVLKSGIKEDYKFLKKEIPLG